MPTISTSNLFVGLTKAATLFTNAMFARTRVGYPSTKRHGYQMVYSIEDSTKIGEAKQEGSRTYIDIIIDLKRAPYAAAYEFGHPEPYTINPVHGQALAIPFGKWNPTGYNVIGKQGYLFWKVEHQSIEAKPFMKPTMNEKRQEIAKIIGNEFRESYIRSIGERRTIIK
jgi:hypothetical protein